MDDIKITFFMIVVIADYAVRSYAKIKGLNFFYASARIGSALL